jgi:hypothetical protein
VDCSIWRLATQPVAVRLLVDTGATDTGIFPRKLREAGLRRHAEQRVAPVGGNLARSPAYRAVGLKTPIHTWRQVRIMMLPDYMEQSEIASGDHCDGLLGLDLLRECFLVLHGPQGTFTLAR